MIQKEDWNARIIVLLAMLSYKLQFMLVCAEAIEWGRWINLSNKKMGERYLRGVMPGKSESQ